MNSDTAENLFADWGDVEAFRQQMRAQGRVQIRPVLAELAAERLLQAAERAPFRLSLNSGAKSMDLVLAEIEALPAAQAAQMMALVHAGARSGFQYMFDTYRLSDEVEAGSLTAGPLVELLHALNSEPMLALFRRLADDEEIAFCDAQVTRYRAGHFLTTHDDDVAGRGRVLAFVLNLTPHWRPDWGGLLLFHGADGAIDGGFSPAFNALNVFKVPRPHSVSLVAPYAEGCRYAITGWARKRLSPR